MIKGKDEKTYQREYYKNNREYINQYQRWYHSKKRYEQGKIKYEEIKPKPNKADRYYAKKKREEQFVKIKRGEFIVKFE